MSVTSVKYKKISLTKSQGLSVEYLEIGSDNQDKVTRKSKRTVHPDLENLFNSLRIHLACVHGLVKPKIAMKDLEDLSQKEKDEYISIVSDISVKSVTFVGKETRGYLIAGKRELLPGKSVAFNSPIINEEEEGYEPCEILSDICEAIVSESNEYLFNKKQAQLELGFEPEGVPASDDEDFDKMEYEQSLEEARATQIAD